LQNSQKMIHKSIYTSSFCRIYPLSFYPRKTYVKSHNMVSIMVYILPLCQEVKLHI